MISIPIKSLQIKNLFTDIRFWIVFLLVIRLIGITNPPLERHDWRQTTGLMVAKNYLTVDSNILYPRIDNTKGDSGIIGMEFPVYYYLIFLISKIFGYAHWYGRLINLVISSVGIYYFYLTLSKFFISKKHSFYSTIILIFSIWFAYSRKTMPDTLSVSVLFIGFYYGISYLFNSNSWHLALYSILGCLGILLKLPAGMYLIALVFLPFIKSIQLKNKVFISICTAAFLAIVYWWYFHWNVHLSAKFGTWYNAGKSLSVGFKEISNNLKPAFENFYFYSFYSYILFGLFLTGIVLMIKNKERKVMYMFISLFVIFILYIFKSGFFFYNHNYYIIPFVPVMAIIAAYPLTKIKKKYAVIILFLGATEAIANQQHEFFIRDEVTYKLSIESLAQEYTNKSDLIAVNGDGNPLLLYLADRKGWSLHQHQLRDSVYLKKIIEKGCDYIIIDKNKYTVDIKLEKIYKNKDFVIYNTTMPSD